MRSSTISQADFAEVRTLRNEERKNLKEALRHKYRYRLALVTNSLAGKRRRDIEIRRQAADIAARKSRKVLQRMAALADREEARAL